MTHGRREAIWHPGRTRSVTLTVIVVASLGAGWVSASSALAAGHAHSALWQGKNDCGGSSTAFSREGSVSFVRSGDNLAVTYRVRGGDPNTTYAFYLFENDGNACTQVGNSGSAAFTNIRGSGSATYSWSVTGYSTFFVEASDGGPFPAGDHNQTTTVSLP